MWVSGYSDDVGIVHDDALPMLQGFIYLGKMSANSNKLQPYCERQKVYDNVALPGSQQPHYVG
jgi:hypothetical protein